MTQRYLLPHVFKKLAPSYRAIDCRIVTTLEEGRWNNALCIIRLRPDELDAVREELSDLQRKFPIKTEHFQVVMDVLPIADWDRLIKQLEKGHVELDGIEIFLKEPFKSGEQSAYVEGHSRFVRSPQIADFPALEFSWGGGTQGVFHNETIAQELDAFGVKTTEAVDALCNVSISRSHSVERGLFLRLPVLATIKELEVEKLTGQLKLVIRYHKSLPNLIASAVLTSGTGEHQQVTGLVPLTFETGPDSELFILARCATGLSLQPTTTGVSIRTSIAAVNLGNERDISLEEKEEPTSDQEVEPPPYGMTGLGIDTFFNPPKIIPQSRKTKAKKDRLETAFNEYQKVQQIGEGGSGAVWKARDSQGTEVAVKILSPDKATLEKRKRFKNEILFSIRVQHQHVINVLDHGVTTLKNVQCPFYVMPLLQGSMRNTVMFTEVITQRFKYFEHIIAGVEIAHLANVVHRDLKPENILYDAQLDALVVADFGIADFMNEELYTAAETRDKARLANFQYAAPEQRSRGHATDVRTDIFALGLMLNELFTGQVPHGMNYATVKSVAKDYGWIDELVAAMIQQDPDRRPESIEAVRRYFPSNKAADNKVRQTKAE